MPVVAVAGGTGKLGRAIVDALNATKQSTVLVLARESSELKEKEIGSKIVAVDYGNVANITEALNIHKVDVLISTVFSVQTNDAELALIEAADRASGKIRFITSSWGIPYTKSMGTRFGPAAHKAEAVAALEKTSLVFSSVHPGYFLDYFCMPKVKSYMDPVTTFIDIQNNIAAIPGSGDTPVVFTHTWDVAKFVAEYVNQPASEWEKDVFIIGDKITMNEFVAIAEEAKGVKFEIFHDSLDKLNKGEVTELPSHPAMYPYFPKTMLQSLFAAFGVFFDNGDFDFNPSKSLHDVFPHTKARTVKEVVNAAWKTE
ncbi:uncharacterized protein VDAG_09184 [Verticillium dahliae VdLs.17]|uniref:NmrA-like domain-containing protein n=1 Tax=Verticillium dahliae (strain VdLs.17 / ATCC MYA-4575 / FGSC 10137) TaxID=498257 RepID=G2XFR0_VERDV|nr:uncharacterized protein VDAG_09184 [Verticillium dahliae VdLs.17]EGY18658.1 hypothetical protein VDAG_09184 [Verticillium dahliae VdLs.17]